MIAPTVVRQFKSEFGGMLLTPVDQEYDAARAVFNAMIDRRPALIAQCTNAADVIEAVRFAREQRLLISVRCTGHNIGGYAVCDDGLVIDLSRMKAIAVDSSSRTVRVEAGCNWGEVNDALQPHGLAATGGFVSVTGVSGLTLGGGLGWLVRKHGLALDNLLSAEVILADGRLVTASASELDDLFWAIRGGAATSALLQISSSRRTQSERFSPASFSIRPHQQSARFSGGASSKLPRLKRARRARCYSTSPTIHLGRLLSSENRWSDLAAFMQAP
jgi:FAD binding domain